MLNVKLGFGTYDANGLERKTRERYSLHFKGVDGEYPCQVRTGNIIPLRSYSLLEAVILAFLL